MYFVGNKAGGAESSKPFHIWYKTTRFEVWLAGFRGSVRLGIIHLLQVGHVPATGYHTVANFTVMGRCPDHGTPPPMGHALVVSSQSKMHMKLLQRLEMTPQVSSYLKYYIREFGRGRQRSRALGTGQSYIWPWSPIGSQILNSSIGNSR